MKKLYIFLLLIIYNNLSASDYWYQPMHGLNTKSIAISGNNIFVGTNFGIFRSTDNGNSWASVNNGLTILDITNVAILHSYVFACSNLGLFKTTDNGDKWELVPYLMNYLITSIAGSGQNLYIGTNLGIFKSTDYGESWEEVNANANIKHVFNITIIENCVYASYYSGLYISTDNGES